MSDIKAIETRYKNHRFRSRLEARWAVFFDVMEIHWEYENQGYQLPSGLYLPDFWLPNQRKFIEVKPVWPNEQEIVNCMELAIGSVCFVGMVFPTTGLDGEDEMLVWAPDGKWNRRMEQFVFADGFDTDEIISRKYKRAKKTACSARFEHGETP